MKWLKRQIKSIYRVIRCFIRRLTEFSVDHFRCFDATSERKISVLMRYWGWSFIREKHRSEKNIFFMSSFNAEIFLQTWSGFEKFYMNSIFPLDFVWIEEFLSKFTEFCSKHNFRKKIHQRLSPFKYQLTSNLFTNISNEWIFSHRSAPFHLVDFKAARASQIPFIYRSLNFDTTGIVSAFCFQVHTDQLVRHLFCIFVFWFELSS